MHSSLIVPILFAIPTLSDDPTVDRAAHYWRQEVAKWGDVIPASAAEDELISSWLAYLCPRPTNRFAPFRGERLTPGALAHSAWWTREFFQDTANPYANRSLPTRYLMETRPWLHTLLMYEWQAKGYSFQLQESGRAVLLRVRGGPAGYDHRRGITGARVAAVLGDVLSKEVLEQGQQFRLPPVLRPGSFVSNAAVGKLGCPIVGDWRNAIVVFITEDDFCILLLKAFSGCPRIEFGLAENDWLPDRLYCADGRRLVIEHLTGKPRLYSMARLEEALFRPRTLPIAGSALRELVDANSGPEYPADSALCDILGVGWIRWPIVTKAARKLADLTSAALFGFLGPERESGDSDDITDHPRMEISGAPPTAPVNRVPREQPEYPNWERLKSAGPRSTPTP